MGAPPRVGGRSRVGCLLAIVFWGYIAAVLAWWLVFGGDR